MDFGVDDVIEIACGDLDMGARAYGEVVAFLNDADEASGGTLLLGFRESLILRYVDVRRNLPWPGYIEQHVTRNGRPWNEDEARRQLLHVLRDYERRVRGRLNGHAELFERYAAYNSDRKKRREAGRWPPTPPVAY